MGAVGERPIRGYPAMLEWSGSHTRVVVICGMRESFQCIKLPALLGNFALLKLSQKVVVIRRVTQDSDSTVILCGSSNERNPPNIDLFNRFRYGNIDLRNGIFEGIEIADDIIYFVDILFSQIFLVGFEIAGEDSGMDSWMEGLHSA